MTLVLGFWSCKEPLSRWVARSVSAFISLQGLEMDSDRAVTLSLVATSPPVLHGGDEHPRGIRLEAPLCAVCDCHLSRGFKLDISRGDTLQSRASTQRQISAFLVQFIFIGGKVWAFVVSF